MSNPTETAPVVAVPPTLHAIVPSQPLPTVFQAVAKAAKACRVAGFDARNEYDKYDYRSIRGVMDAVHQALADAGVTVVLHEMRDLQRSIVDTSKGGKQVLIIYTGVFRIYGPAGDWFETVHYCEGMDRSDKAGNKASSAGYKEVLQKLLTLPFGHDEVEQDGDDRGNIVGEAQPRKQKGKQRQAIDNRPPKIPKPWDGKPDYAVNYDSDHHVYVKLVEGRVLQADVRNMRSEDLTLLEEAIPQRQAWFNQNGYARMAEQASRDQRLVAAELLRRAGDLEDDSADGAAAEAEGPGDDTGGDVPAGAGPDSAKATSDRPDSAGAQPGTAAPSDRPRVVRYAIHLGMVAEADVVRTSQALGEAELKLLSWLEPAEVAAMVVHPLNAPLFNPAEAADVGRHNRAGAVPLTGEWLATAWLPAHEAAKGDRRRDARKLLRLAIANLDLRLRDEKQAAPEMRADEVTDDEWKALRAYTTALTAAAKG